MKQTLAIVVIPVTMLFIGAATGAEYRPKYVNDAMQVCVERSEDQGRGNIEKVVVAIGNEVEFRIVGGVAVCSCLYAGKHSIVLTWPNPNSDSLQKSPVINFTGIKGSIVTFEVCQPTSAPTDEGPWIIRRAGNTLAGVCQ